MKEPKNSWEVSYIIAIKKPHLDLGIKKKDLYLKITRERKSELQDWARDHFNHRWFLDKI